MSPGLGVGQDFLTQFFGLRGVVPGHLRGLLVEVHVNPHEEAQDLPDIFLAFSAPVRPEDAGDFTETWDLLVHHPDEFFLRRRHGVQASENFPDSADRRLASFLLHHNSTAEISGCRHPVQSDHEGVVRVGGFFVDMANHFSLFFLRTNLALYKHFLSFLSILSVLTAFS